MYLMGIDLGSTNWKVVVYDPQGRVKALSVCGAPIHNENEGRAYYDPNELWQTISQQIKSLVAKIKDPGKIVSIAVSSAGEAIVAIDREGRAIGKVFPWFDTRTMELGQWWKKCFSENEIWTITGAPPQHKFSLNHLLWIRKNQPSVFKEAKKWLSLGDYVAYRLSGTQAMNYSIAATTMMFDVKNGLWSDRILSAAYIDPETLPPLVSSGKPLGKVSQQTQRETGLSSKTLVVTGGHDHISGALACGVCREGQALDSAGTAQGLIMPLGSLKPDIMTPGGGFEQRPHVIKNMYYMIGSGQSAGMVLDWITREFVAGKSKDSTDEYGQLASTASRAEPGCRGMFFLPHLRGCVAPKLQEKSRAAFIGIRAYHRREDFLRAALEGLAHEFRVVLNSMELLLGISVGKVVTIGGSTKSHLLVQLKADISGKEMEIPETEEAVALGAALLGGIGAGIYENVEEAIRCVHRVKYRISPNQEMSQFYNELHTRVYAQLYSSLRNINEEIGSIFKD